MLVEYAVPVDALLLHNILVWNGVINGLLIFSLLTVLTAGLIIGKKKLNKKSIATSIYGAVGAGISLCVVSDAPTLLMNALEAKVGGVWTYVILAIIEVWAIVLMVLYIGLIESTPHPIMIGLLQPAVFGFTSFLFSWQIYGVYDTLSLWELKSPFIVLVFSLVCVTYDAWGEDYHSLKTSNGKPAHLSFFGDELWADLRSMRDALFQSTQDEDDSLEFGNAAHVVGTVQQSIDIHLRGTELSLSPRSMTDESVIVDADIEMV